MPSDDRPPADRIINEVFFDKKCGKGETNKQFFRWCMDPKQNTFTTKCQGIGGAKVLCEGRGNFTYKTAGISYREYLDGLNDYLDDPNVVVRATTSSIHTMSSIKTTISEMTTGKSTVGKLTTALSNMTTAVTPRPTTTKPSTPAYETPITYPDRFKMRLSCGFSNDPGKLVPWDYDVGVTQTEFAKITKICYQEIYGPLGMPLWLIILIVLIVLSTLTVAGVLFWRYWLKRRVYKQGGARSTMGSTWTSAPVSNASSFTSSFSKYDRGGKAPESVVARSGSFRGNSRSAGRSMSRAPSASRRSDMSQSSQRSSSRKR